MKFYIYIFIFTQFFSNVSPQKIPDFAKHSEAISKSIGKIEQRYNAGISLSPRYADSTIYYGNQLFKQGKSEENDSAKYLGKILLARGYFNKQQFDSAKFYLEDVLQGLQDKEELFNYYFGAKNLYGLVLWRTNEIERAKVVFEEILDEIDLVEVNGLKTGILINLANINKILGNYNEAIKYFEKAVKLNPDNPFAVANSFLSIGTMYNLLGEFNEADKAFNNSISVKNISPNFLLSVYTSKANNFKKWGKSDSSEFYYLKGLEIAKEIPDHPTKIRPYIEMSQISINKGKLDDAKKYALEAKRISRNINDNFHKLLSDYTLLKINIKEEKFNTAIKLGEKLIQFAKANHLENALRDTYKLMSTAYQSLGNIDIANTYLKMYVNYNEKMKDFAKMRTQIDIKAKYNNSRMQRRITEFEEANKISFLLLVLSGIGIVVFVYFSYYGFKKYYGEKKVTNMLIKEGESQKEKIGNLVKKLKESDVSQTKEDGYIFANNKKIEFTNIIYISSSGHYIYYHLDNRKSPIMERRNLKDILSSLPSNQFVQIHRSFIVNIRHVEHFTLQDVTLSNSKVVRISRTYKNKLNELIDNSN